MSGARRRSPIGTSPFPADALDALLPEPDPASAVGERDATDGDREDDRGGEVRPRPAEHRGRGEQTDADGTSGAATTRARRRQPQRSAQQPRKQPRKQPRDSVPSSRPVGTTKIPISGQINPTVLEEARNAVAFLPTKGAVGFTLNALLEQALRAELGRLRRRYNGGKQFPPRSSALPVGRRIAT